MITVPGAGIPLRTIADRAGVSRMTVSLALRDHPSISTTTRQRIQKLARQLGYCPDPDISRLMDKIRERSGRGGHLKTIGFATAYENRFGWRNEPTGLMYFEGAEQHARDCGFKLEEVWLREPGMSGKRFGQILHSRGMEAVLIAPLPVLEPVFEGFNWNYFSAVALGSSLLRPALHRACHHHFQSMFLLVQELCALGYRRIGLAISEHADERVRYLWRAGYLTAQSLTCEAPLPALFMRVWKKEEFTRWLKRTRPDAIITIGPRVALWLEELGLKVPDDIGLANVDLRPNMIGTTGIEQNSRQLGAAAIDLLLSLLRRHERGIPAVPRLTMIEGSFVRGKTVRRVGPARRLAVD